MEISIVEDETEAEYQEFINEFKPSTCQHTVCWKQVLESICPAKTEPLYLAARENGEIIGVLPSMLYFGGLGPVCVSLPFPGAYGGVVSSEQKAYKGLTEEWIKQARERGCLSATIVTYPFSDDKEYYDKYLKPGYAHERFFQYQDLAAPDRFNRSTHRNLRKAKEAELKVYEDKSLSKLDEWYEQIHTKRMRELNAPQLPKALFENTLRFCADKADMLYVDYAGKTIAGCLFIRHNKIADVFMMAADSEFMRLQPNTVLAATATERYRKRGFETLNWQACDKKTGVYEFKKGFGSKEGKIWYLTKVLGDVSKVKNKSIEYVKKEYPWVFVLPFNELGVLTKV